MPEKVKFEISSWTVVKILLVIVAAAMIYIVRDVVALLFIVLVLVATFSPIIKSWQKYLSRIPAIIALFTLLIAVAAGVVYIIFPPLVNEFAQLAISVPSYISETNFDSLRQYAPEIRNGLQSLSSNIGSITTNVYSFTAGVFGAVFSLLMIIVLTFYMLVEESDIKKQVSAFFSEQDREKGIGVINKIAAKVGSWFRGQMLLGLVIFVIDYVGLLIFGVPYALILALLAGLLEIIPTVGPFISGTIAVLFALTISPWKALFVAIFYMAVQLLENNFLVPKIMQKAIGISPVVIIISVIVGAKLLGVIGAILSIPIAASISVIIIEWPTISKMFSKE
ncbi:MAG: AI-2E family transporter [Candidatus Berkelbacteria bacterium]